MNRRLLKSFMVLTIIVTAGSASTYAAFSSNTVTLSGNTMSAGDSHLRICSVAGLNKWLTTITTNFEASGLIPESSSGQGTELTANSVILVGNDNDNLIQNPFGHCITYGQIAGHSNVSLKMDPTVSSVQCSKTDLDSSMELKFEFFNAAEVSQGASTWKSLKTWQTNTLEYGPVFNPNDTYRVKIYARLRSGDNDEALKNALCSFDVNLTGSQTTATNPAP